MSNEPFALACRHCRWRPSGDLPMGVAAAHFEAEHDTTDIEFDLVVICPRCNGEMMQFAIVGENHHYHCKPCHRTQIIKRRASEA